MNIYTSMFCVNFEVKLTYKRSRKRSTEKSCTQKKPSNTVGMTTDHEKSKIRKNINEKRKKKTVNGGN